VAADHEDKSNNQHDRQSQLPISHNLVPRKALIAMHSTATGSGRKSVERIADSAQYSNWIFPNTPKSWSQFDKICNKWQVSVDAYSSNSNNRFMGDQPIGGWIQTS
jgi:hypothetical protein